MNGGALWGRLVTCGRLVIGLACGARWERAIANRPQDTILPHDKGTQSAGHRPSGLSRPREPALLRASSQLSPVQPDPDRRAPLISTPTSTPPIAGSPRESYPA